MQLSDLPARFPYAFGYMAGAGYIRTIPEAHQAATATDAPASFYDGFQPISFTDISAGGIPPNGEDFNGILFSVTEAIRWINSGGQAYFNSTFSGKVGGYPQGAVLGSTTAGTMWLSKVDNNTVNPDAGASANWSRIASDPQTTANSFVHPNGAIEQWGRTLLSSTNEPVVATTLPIAYSNALYDIQITPLILSAGNHNDTWVQNVETAVSPSGFAAQYQAIAVPGNTFPGLDGYRWRTIGY